MTPEVLTRPLGDNPPVAHLYYGVNALDGLRALADNSVHCVVTSPPYWGLRAYGTPPILWGGNPACTHEWGCPIPLVVTSGLHRMPPNKTGGTKAYTEHLGKDHGQFCLCCNAWRGGLGLEATPDLYVQHLVTIFAEARRVLRDDGTLWLNLGDSHSSGDRGYRVADNKDTKGGRVMGVRPRTPPGMKSKDMVGIPWMVAFAMRAAGWVLRMDVIWHKQNPMPESVTDRPTKAHEYVFLFANRNRYFYDHWAVREGATPASHAHIGQANFAHQAGGAKDFGKTGINANRSARKTIVNFAANPGRNQRSVWTVPCYSYPGRHFATFPPKLVEPMILAGTSAKGCCPMCGAPWGRVGKGGSPRWAPTCPCGVAIPTPCTVLDPFSGSGTTGEVALRLGRNYIGIDLNTEYLPLARARILGEEPPDQIAADDTQLTLFDVLGEA